MGDRLREGRVCGMTIRMALKHIRRLAPETEETLRKVSCVIGDLGGEVRRG